MTIGAGALFVATVVVAAADEVFVAAAMAHRPTVWAALNDAVNGIGSLVFGAVGLLIVVRRGSAVGWVTALLGLAVATMAATDGYAELAAPALAHSAEGPFWLEPWWQLAGAVAWLFATTLLAVLLQVFPDGQPLSRRWRAPLLLTVAWPVLVLVTLTISRSALATLGPLAIVVAGAALASAILRFRRSAGRQRAQLKWFAYGAAMAFGSLGLSSLLLPTDVSYVANSVAITFLPLSVAAAILRHGLYDIDVFIERTLVYGATSATIGAAFFLGIVVLQAALQPITSGSELAVAVSTLLSFALLQPIRRWIQRTVDRRFYWSRYDAAVTIDQFGDELRDDVDLESVRDHLIGAVGRTMSPAHASLWLRQRAR